MFNFNCFFYRFNKCLKNSFSLMVVIRSFNSTVNIYLGT